MLCKRSVGIILILFASALMGCGSTVQFVPVDTTVYEPRPESHVIKVHTSHIEQPHVLLGSVTVTKKMEAGFGGYSTYDIMIGMLKERAREVGGDGLLNIRPVDSEEQLDTTIVLTGQVVRYLEREQTITVK